MSKRIFEMTGDEFTEMIKRIAIEKEMGVQSARRKFAAERKYLQEAAKSVDARPERVYTEAELEAIRDTLGGIYDRRQK